MKVYIKKTFYNFLHGKKKTFQKESVSDIFPEYYIIKVNKFNDRAKDTLDEWIYFFKNSEVKDNFKAKGLKEANDILDIMRLSKEQQYGYNRFLDSLHLKASEAFSLKEEAKFDERIEIAERLISTGAEDIFIVEITKLSIEDVKNIRKKVKEK